MRIWRVEIDTYRSRYNERSSYLIHANTSVKAIEKAVKEAKRNGCYKMYDATSVQLVGDSQ